MRIPIILQARMESKRLPGKSLLNIMGKPLIYYVIQTLKASNIGKVILAVPDNRHNNCLCDIAKKLEIEFIQGSEKNVLSRYVLAAENFPSFYYIRATADNPLVDYEGPERLLNFISKNNLDYAGENGIPLGGGLEIFTKKALLKASRLAKTSADHEHVTLFIKNNPELFKIDYLKVPSYLNYPNLRLTVDYQSDFEFVKSFFESYYKGIPFKLSEIIQLLKNHKKNT